jgi:hypothetical protein
VARPHGPGGVGARPWGWPDTIQELIRHGHRLPDIRGYTIRQIRLFMSAIERAERERRLDEAIMLRMSQADGKDWKSYIRKLEG